MDQMQPHKLSERPGPLKLRPALIHPVVLREDGTELQHRGLDTHREIGPRPELGRREMPRFVDGPFSRVQGVDGRLGLALVPQNEGDRVLGIGEVARQGGPVAGHSP